MILKKCELDFFSFSNGSRDSIISIYRHLYFLDFLAEPYDSKDGIVDDIEIVGIDSL